MLTELKLREVVKAVIARETTALEVTEAYLRKVEENEQFVQAWTFLDQDLARDQARRVDARLVGGTLLAGVPLGIKDVFDTHDMPACYGSEVYRNNRPFVDAAVVAKARSLSAVILGKTVTTEFATFSPGKTKNPHRSSAGAVHTPGGSSSGSAAAVAAGMVPAAIGTQTAASIIRPAAYCGVVGYKPTFGMLMTVGAKPFSPSLDTVGVFARDVEDAAYLVASLAGREFQLDDRALTFGICHTPHWSLAESSARDALERAVSLLNLSGTITEMISLPEQCDRLADIQTGIMLYEAAASYSAETLYHQADLSEAFKALIARGDAIDAKLYADYQLEAAEARRAADSTFELVDVLVAPSAPGEAPEGLSSTGDPIFTKMWNLLGYPCVHVPLGMGERGLPVGVTVVGPRWHDELALVAASRLERLASNLATGR